MDIGSVHMAASTTFTCQGTPGISMHTHTAWGREQATIPIQGSLASAGTQTMALPPPPPLTPLLGAFTQKTVSELTHPIWVPDRVSQVRSAEPECFSPCK